MRTLSLVLIALGMIGLVMGTITFVTVARAATTAPFSMENYGGPGPILGAVVLLLGGLYLFTSTHRED
ncbi:MAG TPA: hypothetical protein VL287_06735 [Gemmatimonadales bacterium]|jgi:hypothetical protein|nr:hypothetical protein [Gemmatimonadales bacterium]